MRHWHQIPGLRTKEELEQLIADEGSVQRIADKVGCSRQTVSKAMRKYGLHKKGYIISEETKRRFNLL